LHPHLTQAAHQAEPLDIFQPEFDALLTHGAQLTSFSGEGLFLNEDRSDSPCTWKELVINHINIAEIIALIPLGSLTRLAFQGGDVFPSSSLHPSSCFLRSSDADNMPEMMHLSLVNLMRCPAWQRCGPKVGISLITEWCEDRDTPELLSLVNALAPLASKEVSLYISNPEFVLGASEVEQLGVALGSGLKELQLRQCKVLDSFWPAVWAHLPGLQQFEVGGELHGATGAHQLKISAVVRRAPCSSFWGTSFTQRWQQRASLTSRAGGWVCLRSLSLHWATNPQCTQGLCGQVSRHP
jgi:hypothetical protein